MRWRVFRLTALYAASLSILVVVAMNPARARTVIRRQARLAVQVVRDVLDTGASAPVVAASPPAAPPASAPEKPQRARADYYRIPIGTVVSVRLRTGIDSSANQVNDQVDAVLSDPVTQEGVELIPAGSLLHGTIMQVEAASRETSRGWVSIAFAVVQHTETGSRAPFRTRAITIEAQTPLETARARHSRQPIDLILPTGHPLLLTLAEPLVVAIPKARPSSEDGTHAAVRAAPSGSGISHPGR